MGKPRNIPALWAQNGGTETVTETVLPMHLKTRDNDEQLMQKQRKKYWLQDVVVLWLSLIKSLNHVIGGEIKDKVYQADELRDWQRKKESVSE